MPTVKDVDLSRLNREQREAVTAEGKAVAVFAGPGSGKTTVLTSRAAWLLQQGVTGGRILVVTFTRAAAREMKERLAFHTAAARDLTIGTFHSVFLRLLRESGIPVPRLIGEGEQAGMLRELLAEKKRPWDEDAVSGFLGQIGYCKNHLMLPERMNVRKEKNIAFRDLFHAYERLKEDRRVWDYDDILIQFYRLLRRPGSHSFRNRYLHILVDEFQDINRVQWECIRLLLPPEGRLFVVGDDDQSIYGFRGSDPGYMLELVRSFPDARRIVLKTNYRSTEEIIRAGQHLIAHNRHRQPKELTGVGVRGSESPVWMEPADEEEEARCILEALRDGKETAVLYRTSTQARAMIDALVQENVPFSVAAGDAAFYRRWQVVDVLSYLKLAENPDDLDALVRVINRPKRYLFGDEWMDGLWFLSRKTGRSLLECLPELEGLEGYQKKHLSRMVREVAMLRELSLTEAVERIRRNIGYDDFLSSMARDLGQDPASLREPVEELSVAVRRHPDAASLLSHIQTVEQRVREKPEHPQVRLMTFHRSKGLEFDRVFLIGLHAMVIPHRRSLQVPEKWKSRAWEEERRLLYVGMTRARRELHLSVSQTRQGRRVGPSPFLKELGYRGGEPPPERTEPSQIPRNRPNPEQPQLRHRKEPVRIGDELIHTRWGEGRVTGIIPLDGTAPGRKVALRFETETRTLHYELSRHLGLLKRTEES
ncbi:DNA helicase-2/ATP-dependent DNA helicase PcrA [Melghirimyces profundicolus]|uniref:DNA 3'-5' helicase n=1 Tax=Melghirimyces profundicolus TaxID=1242148 RepID=A0A2T6BUW7_9BACL|nr:ATP-dependent helicase [Melghirimyces profundicolus]PTX59868.1 DNA helicase-2/ATP-dependent DNA helicase PcrA [Melghirimyces profundicolus]